MIERKLKRLGFTDKEQTVYITILRRGKLTATEIAALSGVERSTVYSVAKELIKKGVIEEDLAGKKQQFVALPPENLSNLLYKEEETLFEKKELIKSLISDLESIREYAGYSVPKITFIPEEEIERFLYKQTPLWNQSVLAGDKTWWGFQDPTLVEFYQEWIDWFWTEAVPKDVVLKLLTSAGNVETTMQMKKYDRRMVRFWNKGEHFSATTWVVGDYMVMLVTNEKPHYLVQIHDARMAENMRALFKGIWEDIK